MKEYTIDDLAQMIDHTNLHTDASSKDMEKLCNEAKDYHFKMVAINQVQSHLCAELLKGTDIHVGAAISFPLGQTTIASKVFDTNNAIEEGATEIDYVINQTEVKNKNWDYIKDEMTQIVAACHAHNIPCKVIFENCYLTDEEKIMLCEIAKEVKPNFIKTSTGFGTGGATFEDVALMKKYVGDEVEVKAAGGIRDANTFIKMIQNGATRIGTSAGVFIIEELKKKKILFVAGGVGTAPVYPQVKWLHEHGVDCDVIMGSRNKDLLILEDEMKKVATNLYVTTDDGSYGFKGTGTAQLQELWDNGNRYDHCVAIGPMIMMKFVCKLTKELGIPTVVSMNPIMVDGTGMCGACRLVVGDEVKFACVDGPEFDGHLVDFDQAMRRQAQYKTEEGRAMLKLQEGATHHGGCGNCNS